MNDPPIDSAPPSAGNSWQYAKDLWSSASGAEAWKSFRNLITTLPGWAIVVLIVGVLGLLANSQVVVFPLAAGAFLTAMYFTIKHAILSALREFDSQRND